MAWDRGGEGAWLEGEGETRAVKGSGLQEEHRSEAWEAEYAVLRGLAGLGFVTGLLGRRPRRCGRKAWAVGGLASP